MALIVMLLKPLTRLRREVRFRVWVLRSRLTLARVGCDLEIVAPHGAAFGTPPVVEPTFQMLGVGDHTQRGRLRIELGRWANLGRHTTIEVLPSADSVISLGDGIVLGTGVRLVAFGGEMRIGPWTRMRDGVMMKSSGRLVVGEHGVFQNFTMIHCAKAVTMADWVSFAERCSVLDSDHLIDGSETYHQSLPIAVDPVEIRTNTIMGANVVILRGARIGANSVVAAGSVVRAGEYPDGWLIAGSPAEAKKALPAARRTGEPAS